MPMQFWQPGSLTGSAVRLRWCRGISTQPSVVIDILRCVVHSKQSDQKVLEYIQETVVEDEQPLILLVSSPPDTKSTIYPIRNFRSRNNEWQARIEHCNQIHHGLNTYWQRDQPWHTIVMDKQSPPILVNRFWR